MSYDRATEYTVYPTGYERMVHMDKYHWTVHVADRGSGWAVIRAGRCLNKDGEWEYESQPSSRTDEFLERCRWKHRDNALRAAHDVVDSVRSNGMTAAEASDWVASKGVTS